MLPSATIRRFEKFGLEIQESEYPDHEITHLEGEEGIVVVHDLDGMWMAHIDTEELPKREIGSEGRHIVVREDESELVDRTCEILDDQPNQTVIDTEDHTTKIPVIPDYSFPELEVLS